MLEMHFIDDSKTEIDFPVLNFILQSLQVFQLTVEVYFKPDISYIRHLRKAFIIVPRSEP